MASQARSPYNERHGLPRLAAVQLISGIIVSFIMISCFTSYEVGLIGLVALVVIITGTAVETWASTISLRKPKKVKTKQLVAYPIIMLAGVVAYIVVASMKRTWTRTSGICVAFQCAFLIGSFAIAVWALKLPPPHRRRTRRPREDPDQEREFEPPPLQVIDNAEEAVEIKVERKKVVSVSDDDGMPDENMPVEIIEFPDGVFSRTGEEELDPV